MIFCGMALAPGRKVRVPLPVPGRTASGDPLPVRSGSGQDAGGHSGVHGCEYVGVQALRRLAVELDPAELSGNVILLPLANPTGFYAGAKQVVPEDGVNLNRASPAIRRHPVGPAGLCAGNCPLPGGRLFGRPAQRGLQRGPLSAGVLPHSGDGRRVNRRPDGRPGADSALPGPLHRPKRPLQLGRAEKHSRAAH